MSALNRMLKGTLLLASTVAVATVAYLSSGSESRPLEWSLDSENSAVSRPSSVDEKLGIELIGKAGRTDKPALAQTSVFESFSSSDQEGGSGNRRFAESDSIADAAEAVVHTQSQSVHRPGSDQAVSGGLSSIYGSSQAAELPVDSADVEQPKHPFALEAMGPVEAILATDDGTTELIVVGQTFKSSGDVGVSVGDYVYAGSVGEGELDLLIPVGQEYLLGISEIRIAGEIDAVQPQVAQFSIGDTSFDYSQLLSGNPNLTVKPGDFVEVVGSQTGSEGSILLGIHGSGIGFSSLQGIHGSGIGFSSLQGIHGSGIGFSSLQGIHGSGIGFSSLQGIHGSGISEY